FDADTQLVDVSDAILLSPISASPLCFGTCDGSITLSNAFDYLWGTGDTTSVLQNLCAGTYTVTVSDTSGTICKQDFGIVDPIMTVYPYGQGFCDTGSISQY